MAKVKTSLRLKREPEDEWKSDNESVSTQPSRSGRRLPARGPAAINAERKSHKSKGAITKGAVLKSDNKSKEGIAKAVATKAAPNNGRHLGRKLIRWTAHTDQTLLLCMEYELRKAGVEIPFNAIARRLAKEKMATGASMQQHLNKLRLQMLERGSWVPPYAGRGNLKKDENVRGMIKCQGGDAGNNLRYIGWDEDITMFMNPVDAELDRLKKGHLKIKGADSAHEGSDDNRHKDENSSLGTSHHDGDDDVESDDEPNISPNQINGRKTRRSFRTVGFFHDDGMSDDELDDMEIMVKGGGNGSRMMIFNDSEEEFEHRKILIAHMGPRQLAKFPAGISGIGDDQYDLDDVREAYPPVTIVKAGEGYSKEVDDEADSDYDLDVEYDGLSNTGTKLHNPSSHDTNDPNMGQLIVHDTLPMSQEPIQTPRIPQGTWSGPVNNIGIQIGQSNVRTLDMLGYPAQNLGQNSFDRDPIASMRNNHLMGANSDGNTNIGMAQSSTMGSSFVTLNEAAQPNNNLPGSEFNLLNDVGQQNNVVPGDNFDIISDMDQPDDIFDMLNDPDQENILPPGSGFDMLSGAIQDNNFERSFDSQGAFTEYPNHDDYDWGSDAFNDPAGALDAATGPLINGYGNNNSITASAGGYNFQTSSGNRVDSVQTQARVRAQPFSSHDFEIWDDSWNANPPLLAGTADYNLNQLGPVFVPGADLFFGHRYPGDPEA